MKKFTTFKGNVTKLLQAYISLENAAKQNDTTRINQISLELDKIYESIFDNYFEINESDKWLYDDLKHTNKERYGMNEVFDYLTDKLINEMEEENRINQEGTKDLQFYKENGIWYIDLPEFIEEGLGTKANLMMVDGADVLLDLLSDNTEKVTLKLNSKPFEGVHVTLDLFKMGKDQQILDQVGHANVDYGAYYHSYGTHNDTTFKQTVWLCPVTEYVFNGYYPENIYVKKVN